MIFTIFRDFSRFFLIKSIKMNKKESKNGLIIARVPRGCDVAHKATWQSHAGPRSASMAHRTYLFIHIIITYI